MGNLQPGAARTRGRQGIEARGVFVLTLIVTQLFLGASQAHASGSTLRVPFRVAELQLTKRGPKIGRWKSTKAVSALARSDIMVVAPWCVACSKTLEHMKANQRADKRIELIVIPRSEVVRAQPNQLAQYRGMNIYVGEDQALRGVRAYPSWFRCGSRGACVELSDAEKLQLMR